MKVKSLVNFSSVPKGTTGSAVKDGDDWVVTWDLERTKPLSDWFTEREKTQYLAVV